MELETMRTWAEIHPGHLEHNYRALRACAPESRFLATVKANAYGHEAIPTARQMQELGADYLAVACLAEGRQLREAGITLPILILGLTPPEMADEVVSLNLTQAVFTPELAKALSDAAGAQRTKAKIHLAVDSGMGRIGVLAQDPQAAAAELASICSLPHLHPEGIFTHFAVSDAPGPDCEDYTMVQFTRFLDVIAALHDGYSRSFEIRHCANSGAVLQYPCTAMDMVRPGIALYGHYPDPCTEGLDGPGLLPVMSLKTRVAAVRSLPAGTPVSYGCTAKTDTGRIAVLPIGYADGLHRALSNKGSVYCNGRMVPILGRICMDMCMVSLPEDLQVSPGDVAEVFGENLPLEQQADLAGTISYELLCAVAPRVPRIRMPA